MVEHTELELLITVVVGADDDHTARAACRDLTEELGGRIVESGDCSDEEPGCRSVTIARAGESATDHVPATLSRAVRNLLRRLGPEFARHRVSCEPPTAWTVVDNPELVTKLVTGGERLLVEAWAGGSGLVTEFAAEPEDEPAAAQAHLGDLDEHGMPRPRLGLLVDVVTERRAGAEWPARALASRLSRSATILECREQPPMVRVTMDLGPAEGEPRDIVRGAVSALGGNGWSRLRENEDSVMARWSAAPTPPSGIAAIELSAASPSRAGTAP